MGRGRSARRVSVISEEGGRGLAKSGQVSMSARSSLGDFARRGAVPESSGCPPGSSGPLRFCSSASGAAGLPPGAVPARRSASPCRPLGAAPVRGRTRRRCGPLRCARPRPDGGVRFCLSCRSVTPVPRRDSRSPLALGVPAASFQHPACPPVVWLRWLG